MSGHVYDPILVAEYYNVQVNLWRYFFSLSDSLDSVVNNYCSVAASGELTTLPSTGHYTEDASLIAAMFVYECLITFGEEVDLFWTNRMTGATVLFLLNRWIVMFFTWYDVLADITIPATAKVCLRLRNNSDLS